MFGWVRRRRVREQQKLFYQNFSACQSFIVIFESGEFFEYMETVRRLEEMLIRMKPSCDFELVDWKDMEGLLDCNHALRTLYDAFNLSRICSFDDRFAPEQGWADYYKSLL